MPVLKIPVSDDPQTSFRIFCIGFVVIIISSFITRGSGQSLPVQITIHSSHAYTMVTNPCSSPVADLENAESRLLHHLSTPGARIIPRERPDFQSLPVQSTSQTHAYNQVINTTELKPSVDSLESVFVDADVLASSLEKVWLSPHVQETTAVYLTAALASGKQTASETSENASPQKFTQETIALASGSHGDTPSLDAEQPVHSQTIKDLNSEAPRQAERTIFEQQISELKLSVDILEKERDLYFSKLRDIVILCQTPNTENLPVLEAMKIILYDAEAQAMMVP